MSDVIDVKNPRTGEVDYQIQAVNAEEISVIAAKARAAQINWNASGLKARCEAILKFADILEAHAGSVAQALEIDTGRRKMSQGEVFGVIANLRAWAERAPRLKALGLKAAQNPTSNILMTMSLML